MWFNISKFSKELSLLRVLKKDLGLSVLRQKVLKDRLLSSLASADSDSTIIEPDFSLVIHKRVWVYATIPLALVILTGGTIFASAKSLPGDALYGVKKLKEKVETAIAISDTAQAKVEAKHAETRLDELEVITNQAEAAAPETPQPVASKAVKLEVEATSEAHVQLEKALNVLSDVSLKLEDKGETQAATQIKQKIDELTVKATNTVFDVEVEKEHGRYQVKLKTNGNYQNKNSNGSENSSDNAKWENNSEERLNESEDSYKIIPDIQLPNDSERNNSRNDKDEGSDD